MRCLPSVTFLLPFRNFTFLSSSGPNQVWTTHDRQKDKQKGEPLRIQTALYCKEPTCAPLFKVARWGISATK